MNFYTTVLGSGAAIPTLARHCSGQVVNINGFRFLLDCGEGSQNQIRAYHLRLLSIDLVCISHLHGDHFFGLPGLLATMHLCGRTNPVTIIGPEGIRDVLDTLFEKTSTHLDFELVIHELPWVEQDDEVFVSPMRQVFENRQCVISAFPIIHSVPTFGYRIDEKPRGQLSLPRSYAYCCDTAYTEAILPNIQGVSLLCLECTFDDAFASVADEKKHLTASRAARLALLAQPKQLLLTHFSARFKTIDGLQQCASAIFQNTLMAEDGVAYGVGCKKS